jgi:DHA1 family bicyclomycin/chloramphenicol resistance-like MFS transporter
MACFQLSVSNFGAMAMEPVGAVAGIGASLQGFVSTFGGALVGASSGGSSTARRCRWPPGAGLRIASLVFVLLAEKGRLFRGHHES